MLQSISRYVYKRRRGLAKAVGIAGGVYLIGRYITSRLEEVRESVMQANAAREGLKRRFQQTQEDVSYTIMALIPTLANQILEEMSVEELTKELKNKSRKLRSPVLRSPPPPSESSLASSLDWVPEPDVRSESGSVSVSSLSGSGRDSNLGDPSQSWVDTDPSGIEIQRTEQNPQRQNFSSDTRLSESVITATSGVSSGNEESSRSDEADTLSSDVSSKSKAKLWEEIKILTFTRTLTVLYSTSLLSLFTTIQLTLLGRSKYVHSVIQLEHDGRMRERLELNFSPASLLFGGLADMLDYGDEPMQDSDEGVSEDLEMKYLTLSWWILHVGWKDVSERVRRGVEEVFDGVSLKTKLGALDLHRLVYDVRRRVEHEITFEGHERRINFASSLLPPTAETLQHILVQGGVPSHSAAKHSSLFTSLLDETRAIITSSDFERVFEVCLDRATDILFDGLHKNVFTQSGQRVDETAQENRLRLAGLLPGLARWSHLALNGLPNELVDGLLDVREVAALSAIAFSKFEDCFR